MIRQRSARYSLETDASKHENAEIDKFLTEFLAMVHDDQTEELDKDALLARYLNAVVENVCADKQLQKQLIT